MAGYNFQEVPTQDFSRGIDQKSAPSNIPEGFSEDLVNVITDPNGFVAKRPGYEGFYGYLPIRITSVSHSGTSIRFTLDSSINIGNIIESPIVVYGKLSSAQSGDWSTSNNGEYYTTFSSGVLSTLSAPSGTATISDSVHGVLADEVAIDVAQATNIGTLGNRYFIPDRIDINNASTFDVDVTGTQPTAIDFYTLIADKNTVAGTSYVHPDQTCATGTTAISISAGTHGLSNYNIIPYVYYLDGSEYVRIYFCDVTVNTSTGAVTVTIVNSGASMDVRVVLSAADPGDAVLLTIPAGDTGTINISTTDAFNFFALYSASGAVNTLVTPDSVEYNDVTETLTVSIVNSGTSAQSFKFYWEAAVIQSSVLTVTDNGGVSTSYTDSSPQLTLWGIPHGDIYSTSDYQEGFVNHIDTYRTNAESRVMAGLGGNLFGAYTRSEADAGYLIPTANVDLEGQVDSDTLIAPVFVTTGDSEDRTNGNIAADDVVDNKALVTDVTWISSGVVKYTLSLTNKSGSLATAINTTSATADRLTVTGMANSINNGTFKITAIDNSANTITVTNSLATEALFDETGAQGRAGIFTDRVVLTANSKLFAGDTFDSEIFDGFSPTVLTSSGATVVLQGVTGRALMTSGTTLYPVRTTDVIPLTAATNFVRGDMCSVTGLDRKVRVISVNNSSDLTISSITGDGTTATLTSASAHGLRTGQKAVLLRTGVDAYDTVVEVLTVPNTTSFTFASTSTSTGSAGVILGKTIQIDEELEVQDSAGTPVAFSVEGRWLPIEAPTTSDTLPVTTYRQHFAARAYHKQQPLRSTMVKDNLYFTDSENQVMKFDGSNLYQAGLFRWQPQLFAQVDTTTASIALEGVTATVSSATGNQVTLSAGASQFQAGDKIVHQTGTYATYIVQSVDAANELIYTTTTWSTGGTATISKVSRYKYYFRLNALDANKNIIASAATGKDDFVVDMTAAGQIHIRLVGMPVWGIYDYDAIELEVYRTAKRSDGPFYRVGVRDVSFTAGAGYIDFQDSTSDDFLVDFDPVSVAVGLGANLGTGWTQPTRAKHITSIGNRLVLANLLDYQALDITLRHNQSVSSITVSDLNNKKFLFKKDTTDSGTSTNMSDRVTYEFVTSSAGTLASTTFTFVDGDVSTGSDTVTEVGHGLQTGWACFLTTTGVLPGGLATSTKYFVIKVDADTIKFATTLANAVAGTAIDITSAAGGGTHTLTCAAIATTASTFTLQYASHGLAAGSWIYLYHSATGNDKELDLAGWFMVNSATTHTATVNFSGHTRSTTGSVSTDVNRWSKASTVANVPVWLGTDGNLNQVGANTINEHTAMTRLANAINATMRMTDVSVYTSFVPWMVAQAGDSFGLGRMIIRQEKPSSTTLAVVLPESISSGTVFVEGIRRAASAEVDATERRFQSRVVTSFPNFPELFNAPYGDEANSQVTLGDGSTLYTLFDINPEDGQEITGILPLLSESVFGQGTAEETLVVFKSNSVYVVDMITGRKARVQSRGLGCTAPDSIAATSDGIMFANESGVFKLTKDLQVLPVGENLERFYKDSVNRDQITLLKGHHYGQGQQYKLSVPVGTDQTRNNHVLVYNYRLEGQDGRYGAWTRFTNHAATGWANLDADAFFATVDGQVFRVRNSNSADDFRDDADAVDEMVILPRANHFGAPGTRKSIRNVVSHFHLRHSSMTGTTLELSQNLDGVFEVCDTFDITKTATNKVEPVRSPLPKRKMNYIQLRYTNSTKDEGVVLAGIDYHAALLNYKGVPEGAN